VNAISVFAAADKNNRGHDYTQCRLVRRSLFISLLTFFSNLFAKISVCRKVVSGCREYY